MITSTNTTQCHLSRTPTWPHFLLVALHCTCTCTQGRPYTTVPSTATSTTAGHPKPFLLVALHCTCTYMYTRTPIHYSTLYCHLNHCRTSKTVSVGCSSLYMYLHVHKDAHTLQHPLLPPQPLPDIQNRFCWLLFTVHASHRSRATIRHTH